MNVYEEAVKLWGVEFQLDMLVEECVELMLELVRDKRGRNHNIEEEAADVLIMIKQMDYVFNPKDIQGWYRAETLTKRFDSHKPEIIKANLLIKCAEVIVKPHEKNIAELKYLIERLMALNEKLINHWISVKTERLSERIARAINANNL